MGLLSSIHKESIINLLSQTTKSSYILAFSDENGNLLEVVSESKHIMQFHIAILKSEPITSFFSIPNCKNLNELYKEPHKEGSLNQSAKFCSNNRAESLSEVANFMTSLHLSDLTIFRINPALFAAMISLNSYYHHLSSIRNQRIAITDNKGKLLAYTMPFNDIFPSSQKKLLGTNLSDILTIEQTESNSEETDSTELTEIIRINKGKEWSNFFKPILNSSTALNIDDNGNLIIANSSETEYSYLELVSGLNTDLSDFSIECGGIVTKGSTANIIIRGVSSDSIPMIQINPPDYLGYNISTIVNRLLLKKSAIPVGICDNIKIIENEPFLLSINKHDTKYTIKYNSKDEIVWNDNYPFSAKSFDRIYLFLRPNSSLTLSSFSIMSGPTLSVSARNSQPAIATTSFNENERFFHVHKRTEVWNDQMVQQYVFEEITDLKKNIINLERETERLSLLASEKDYIIGKSTSIMTINKNLSKVAKANLTVLIEGETGTGKDVLAKRIHMLSDRRDKPFIKIDCASIPGSLLESELFGHEKGAFTGAVSARKGRFELADGGIVFIDEISNIPINLQVKLLSVIQDKCIQRIGGLKKISLDIKFICATNIQISTLIKTGKLREDLSYRINQYRISLPPLRERREDIPLLSEYFLKEASAIYKREFNGFSEKTMAILCSLSWPGNIRELRNEILRMALLSEKPIIDDKLLFLNTNCKDLLRIKNRRKKRAKISEEMFVSSVKEFGGNVRKISEHLSIGRPLVYKLLKKSGINLDELRLNNTSRIKN
ncbi:MAG: sigma-54-dependent Fis family transcriptional regulator [Fibrobacteres bacterium]|nr:sigma-54-dependent Fis family transcriptional regulator [Fibrobacterota bacterium]